MRVLRWPLGEEAVELVGVFGGGACDEGAGLLRGGVHELERFELLARVEPGGGGGLGGLVFVEVGAQDGADEGDVLRLDEVFDVLVLEDERPVLVGGQELGGTVGHGVGAGAVVLGDAAHWSPGIRLRRRSGSPGGRGGRRRRRGRDLRKKLSPMTPTGPPVFWANQWVASPMVLMEVESTW